MEELSWSDGRPPYSSGDQKQEQEAKGSKEFYTSTSKPGMVEAKPLMETGPDELGKNLLAVGAQ